MTSEARSGPDIPSFDPASIIFQGSGVLAVNKPAGVPVHRGTAHSYGLAEIIEEWVRRNPGVIEIRAGRPIHPVHRLDLEASGVLLFGLGPASARKLQEAFSNRTIRKKYLAVLAGPVDAVGHVHGRVRSRLRGVYRMLDSELTFRRLRGDERLSLVEVIPVGGRTHQIRELFAKIGRPLAGDLRYGKPTPSRQFLEKFQVPWLLLHALELVLPEEILGAEKTLLVPAPPEFHRVIAAKGWAPLEEPR